MKREDSHFLEKHDVLACNEEDLILSIDANENRKNRLEIIKEKKDEIFNDNIDMCSNS